MPYIKFQAIYGHIFLLGYNIFDDDDKKKLQVKLVTINNKINELYKKLDKTDQLHPYIFDDGDDDDSDDDDSDDNDGDNNDGDDDDGIN